MNVRPTHTASDVLAIAFRPWRRTEEPLLRRRPRPAGTGWIASLRDRHDWPGAAYPRCREAVKYLARSACLPWQHGRYLHFIQGQGRLRALRQRDPRLLERHLHRFVNLHWGRRERLRALLSHYRFMLARLPGALFDAVYLEGGVPLGLLALKDGRELVLSLRPSIHKGCEGELTLQLDDLDGRVLYRIVFTVIDDGEALAIGCLQGPGGADARDVVRDLTRNMHGLRPKQLMLGLTYAFARQLGIARVLGIANAAHPLHRRRGERFQADYDAFWLEQQGVARPDGWFALPAEAPHKSEADVPSNHRSAFRRREALRIRAEELLAGALRRAPLPSTMPASAAHGMPFPMPLEHAWIP